MPVHRFNSCRAWAFLGAFMSGALVVAAAPQGRYIRHAEAQPILEELADILPVELRALPDSQAETSWSAWISGHDSNIRARLAQGDEDTIINWLMFGTSFTLQPRAVLDQTAISDPQAVRHIADVIRTRADDLVRALQSPGTDERRLFARHFLEGNGFSFTTPRGLEETRDHLLRAIQRIAVEQGELTQEQDAARRTGDTETELAVRSTLYHARGLSLDTSLAINYAVEQSLAEMKRSGVVKAGSVRRVAIIGGGLDVADRDVGFDFYPQQTVQPFAILDSLRKLQLAQPAASPDIVVFDISPRVIDHLTRTRTRAVGGDSYTLNLPLAKRKNWVPEFRAYWRTFGTRIGVAVPILANTEVADQADVRAVRIPGTVVRHVSVADLDIITQRVDNSQFDLIIATNVLIYYDALEQELAAANIGAMLRNGGILVSNTALPEIEAVPMELIGSSTTVYTRAQDSDQILWYQRRAGPLK